VLTAKLSVFRQRTRDRIADLEQQVIEIQDSSSQKEAQLQHEVQTLREHNSTLVRCLESIADLASTTASPHGDSAGLHGRFGT
jgi:Mg2+ and Co2+ transporter CorA